MRRDLARRTLTRPTPPARRVQSGDDCPAPGCGGRLHVYHTHCTADARIRYLECDRCGWKPDDNKQIVPLEFAPPRRRAV